MTIESPATVSTLGGIAAILQAVAWPLVAFLFFLIYRTKVGAIIDVIVQKLGEAKHLKAGQIEIDTEAIDRVVDQAGRAANQQEVKKEIPGNQIEAARLVGEKLDASPVAFSQKLDAVHRWIYGLVDEYEKVRRDLGSCLARTRAMNEITAKIRAYALVAHPLLPSLMEGSQPGERLAAICILQVKPELGQFYWLVDRIMQEEQAFILFHASLAILELVKTHRYLSRETSGEAIRSALEHVNGFSGGKPDQNTVDVLNEALSLLRG